MWGEGGQIGRQMLVDRGGVELADARPAELQISIAVLPPVYF